MAELLRPSPASYRFDPTKQNEMNFFTTITELTVDVFGRPYDKAF
jgi:hypothetical protein